MRLLHARDDFGSQSRARKKSASQRKRNSRSNERGVVPLYGLRETGGSSNASCQRQEPRDRRLGYSGSAGIFPTTYNGISNQRFTHHQSPISSLHPSYHARCAHNSANLYRRQTGKESRRAKIGAG